MICTPRFWKRSSKRSAKGRRHSRRGPWIGRPGNDNFRDAVGANEFADFLKQIRAAEGDDLGPQVVGQVKTFRYFTLNGLGQSVVPGGVHIGDEPRCPVAVRQPVAILHQPLRAANIG